jgi:hypothetical protein
MLRKAGDRFLQSVRVNLKLVGWWPLAVSAICLGVFFILGYLLYAPPKTEGIFFPRRVLETVVPLAFALQAAFLLGPDNEPALELLLSYPRRVEKLFWERTLLVGILHTAIGLTFTLLFALTWHSENILLSLLRWIPSAIFLAGVTVFTTQLTRQGVFGMLLGTLYWAASFQGGDSLLTVWRWFWPFHVFLQPEKYGLNTYLLNRFFLASIGIGLTLIALTFLKDEDRLLGNR